MTPNKVYLVDPNESLEDIIKSFEDENDALNFGSTGLDTEEYNKTVPEHYRLSPQEEADLIEDLTNFGLLEEVSVH